MLNDLYYSALVRLIFFPLLEGKEREHSAVLCLSVTLGLSPPAPSLHCYLKREVKVIIIHLPQTN